MDMAHCSIRKMASRQCISAFSAGMKIAQDYYPETMGAAYVVNAPALFSGLYNMVKGFVDEATRAKVRIMGTNYQ